MRKSPAVHFANMKIYFASSENLLETGTFIIQKLNLNGKQNPWAIAASGNYQMRMKILEYVTRTLR
jgi:hypothetical protein